MEKVKVNILTQGRLPRGLTGPLYGVTIDKEFYEFLKKMDYKVNLIKPIKFDPNPHKADKGEPIPLYPPIKPKLEVMSEQPSNPVAQLSVASVNNIDATDAVEEEPEVDEEKVEDKKEEVVDEEKHTTKKKNSGKKKS